MTMRWNRIMAAAAAGAALTASVAVGAVAAPDGPSRLGQFSTWRGARAAAGFALLRPTRTYGQKRSNEIFVTRCEAGRKARKQVMVVATYGLKPSAGLTLRQDNAGIACAMTGRTRQLAKVTVQGASATLSGECGRHPMPACSSRQIFLFLTWKRHGIYYAASSFGEWPKTLVGFARALRPVG